MKVDGFSVKVEGLNGYQAPEIMAEISETAWRRKADREGIILRAYHPVLSVEEDGIISAWLVDQEEDCYILKLNFQEEKIKAVYHSKAKRNK